MSIQSDLVEEWSAKIKDGKTVRDTWIKTFRVPDLDKYYEGFQRPGWWPEKDFFTVNLINPNIREQVDNLYTRDPEYTVVPKVTRLPAVPQVTQFLERQATLRQSILNYRAKEKSQKREIKRALLDAFITFGVTKTYYVPYFEQNENAGKPFTDQSGLPVIDRQTGEELKQPEQNLVQEVFETKRRNPLNIIFDPWSDSIENCKWIAEQIEYTIEEIKNNDLLKNTEDISATSVLSAESEGDQMKQQEKDRKKGSKLQGIKNTLFGSAKAEYDDQQIVTCYEIYDLVNNKIIVIADSHPDELRNDETPKGIEGHPFNFLIFQERRDSAYPIPEVFNQIGIQDEYNVTRNQIVLHRKRFGRKYEVGKGAYDEDELSKLEDPYDGMVIKRKGDGAIKAIEDPSLDQAVYFDTHTIKMDFQDIAGGVGEGQISKIEKTGVAQSLERKSRARKGGKVFEFYDFLIEIGQKQLLLMEAEMTAPMAIPILGPAGQEWSRVNPGDIQSLHAEYEYNIILGSTAPREVGEDRDSWLAFLQIFTASPHIGMSEHLMRRTAEMFNITDESMINELRAIAEQMLKAQQEQGQGPGKPGVNVPGQGAVGG